MNDHKPSIDGYMYGLAIILALIIRLVNLGSPPLNDFEAAYALQALQTAQGVHILSVPQSAYIQLTALFFGIFSSSDFLARLWPALFGTLLVLIPIILRSRIGRWASLTLAFLLAFDPGMVALSRQAGSPMIALAGGTLALAFWIAAKPRWAGVFLGLSLLGGESIWLGAISLFAAYGLLYLFDRSACDVLRTWINVEKPERGDLPEGQTEPVDDEHPTKKNEVWTLALFAAGTILAVGTLFFTRPDGLSGLGSGLAGYFGGWVTVTGVSFVKVIVALVVYAPLALFLGVWGGFRAWREKDAPSQFLSLWAGMVFLLILVYPGRQVDYLAWVIVPLWFLAVREFLHHVQFAREELGNTINQGILTFVILVFCWFNLQGIANSQLSGGVISSQLIAIGIGMLILVIASLFVSWGWSSSIAGRGLVWGVSSILLIYTLAMMTSAGSLRPEYTSELWTRGNSLPQANLFVNTINELSDAHTGVKNNLDIVVVGIKSPGLEWALRQFPGTIFTSELAVGTMPSIVISPQQTEPSLAASYRGDGFDLLQQPDWSLFLPDEYVPWLIFHKAPQRSQSVILWARVDLFPGGTLTTTSPNQ